MLQGKQLDHETVSYHDLNQLLNPGAVNILNFFYEFFEFFKVFLIIFNKNFFKYFRMIFLDIFKELFICIMKCLQLLRFIYD